jgi:hypothetical protein
MRVVCAALVLLSLGCGPTALHRRALLTDDLDPYAPRGQVTTRILGGGWCMADSSELRDVFRRCPRDANLWLAMDYKEGRLVSATLLVALPSPSPGRVMRASGGPGRVTVDADPYHGTPERVLVMDHPLDVDPTAAQSSQRHDVLEALADEWRARFGAPFGRGTGWYEWRPRPGLRAVLALTRLGVVELYRFDPAAIMDGELVALPDARVYGPPTKPRASSSPEGSAGVRSR